MLSPKAGQLTPGNRLVAAGVSVPFCATLGDLGQEWPKWRLMKVAGSSYESDAGFGASSRDSDAGFGAASHESDAGFGAPSRDSEAGSGASSKHVGASPFISVRFWSCRGQSSNTSNNAGGLRSIRNIRAAKDLVFCACGVSNRTICPNFGADVTCLGLM